MKPHAVLLAALLLAACGGDDNPPPPPPQPQPTSGWTLGPIYGGVNYSPGVTWEGDGFTFPTAPPGVHGLTRTVTEAGRNRVTLQYRIDGDATFTEVDCGSPDCVHGPGQVRLFLQRCGDDWSGGAKASYRFYSQPLDLAPGPATLQAALVSDLWTNVNGQYDAEGFAAALADLCTVGTGFGRMFAMHGVYAVGSARFVLVSYVVD